MPKLNVQQNNANVIKALRNALAIGQIKGPIASDGNDNFSTAGSNPNLLDNAYFVGGGSQLGDGNFPINQRGQSSYASDGPGIDRWKQFAATVTLSSDGVTVTPSAYSNNFLQLMNPAKWNALVGETVTLSIEVLAVTGTITVAGYNTGLGTITSTGIAAFTFTMPSGIADGNKFFGIAGQNGSSIKFGRWKLEKGTVSTLANDAPPDFGEELQKCQHYLYAVTFPGYVFTGQICLALDTQNINWNLITPVPMVQNRLPSITASNSLNTNGVAISGLTSVNYPFGNNVKISGQASGLTAGQLYAITTAAEVKVLISTEL